MATYSLTRFVRNVSFLFRRDLRLEYKNRDNSIKDLYNCVGDLPARYTLFRLSEYFNHHPSEAKIYADELAYLRQNMNFCCFPYSDCNDYSISDVDINVEDGIPFVIHDGKRLFFPSDMDHRLIQRLYAGYVCEERFLELSDAPHRPHQYQSSRICVSKGDVLFDIGSAEGLFVLDNIDRVDKAILVESDPQWVEPLHRTFAPFGDKVEIVEKFIGTNTDEHTITIAELLNLFPATSSFFKMDVEGFELPALLSVQPTLASCPSKLKFSVATYHKNGDYESIKKVFSDAGFETEPSTGYMLFTQYDEPEPPFFRHGILRAINR